MSDVPTVTSDNSHPRNSLSGRWVVVAMFAMGFTFIGILWGYWFLHTAPFLPLQKALAEEFPDSRPLVQGGQEKMHERSTRILRIVMHVDFDPTQSDGRAEAFAGRVADFSRKHHSVEDYEVFEINLYWPEPEREIKQQRIEIEIDSLPEFIEKNRST